MLTKILSKNTCAECRICCNFDDSDIWETPVINTETKNLILQKFPQQRFLLKDNYALLDMGEKNSEGLYICPMLSKNGCILDENKPFDCKIWPFRVMKLADKIVITVSPICPFVYNKPLNEIMDFLYSDLKDFILSQAEKDPSIIKTYIDGYPILYVE